MAAHWAAVTVWPGLEVLGTIILVLSSSPWPLLPWLVALLLLLPGTPPVSFQHHVAPAETLPPSAEAS